MSIKAGAEDFLGKAQRLDMLFNNVCIFRVFSDILALANLLCSGDLEPPIKALTEDGYDVQFSTNTLGEESSAFFRPCTNPALMLI
jgi:NAD(P)-dependent dehydrogenase (short-subunit alcohol dehydrogenase family)